ncbi:unannotated protein [freshwater metagenome]|uniref:Unannotated protein n=1 Tax=freshwater metagenome TaxID=449393 RepID=A0A6J6P005_9ZZZZ
MFYISYMLAELRRRRGRTLLTALGLAVGVGLVVTVNALSTGLNQAQAKVLKPLTGLGTDMSVTRPLVIATTSGGFQSLTPAERAKLRSEGGPRGFDFQSLKPGAKFSSDRFTFGTQQTFPSTEVASISKLAHVSIAAGSLTLNAVHISGTVPKQTTTATPGPGGFSGGGGGGFFSGPRSINFDTKSVTGIDETQPTLGAITTSQISSGAYFSGTDPYQAILNVSYANSNNLKVGSKLTLAGKTFAVIGIATTPLGGQSSDVYLKLAELQKLSGNTGRVNTILVEADNASHVAAVSTAIKKTFKDSSVTTAKDLADRISGSLVDTKKLTDKLGTALEIVGLVAAILIASLLTLSSVTKRIRELGTLKALGWSQGLVIRQVTGESLFQGLVGGVLGVVVGLGGAALVSAFAPSLQATVGSTSATANAVTGQGGGPGDFGPPGGGAGLFGRFLDNGLTTGSSSVSISAPVSISLLATAIGLAVLGGLLAGAVGGFRASRLRPADALRHLD